jgi:hypothetical protein
LDVNASSAYFQDQLLKRQIRERTAKPHILSLNLFQPLHLIAFSGRRIRTATGNK